MEAATIYASGEEYDRLGSAYAGGAELEFYRCLVEEAEGDVLELGCGTGRIAIPLAEQGRTVVGLDIAPTMLEQARIKAANKGIAGASFVEGDVRDFALERTFGLILFPINSLSHLHTGEDLAGCFGCVRRHLAPHGRFVIDVFVPSLALLARDPAQRYPVASYVDVHGEPVTVTESSRYDAATQINYLTWFYRRGDAPEETARHFGMRQFFPQELDALLAWHGFTIENKYGDYDQRPFDATATRQLIVCRKRTSPSGERAPAAPDGLPPEDQCGVTG